MKKNRLLVGLCLFCFAWAMTASFFLYLEKKKDFDTPLLTPEASTSGLKTIEQMNFVRRFLNQYLNYRHEEFWESQMAVAYLMTPTLRDKRILEVERLTDGISDSKISQNSVITSLFQVGPAFAANISATLIENDKQTDFQTSVSLTLAEIPRTAENPWGLQIDSLLTGPVGQVDLSSPIPLALDAPLTMQFPCMVKNFEVPKQAPLIVRITSFSTSEIQMTSTSEKMGNLKVKAYCEDRQFEFEVKAKSPTTDENNSSAHPLWLNIPESFGQTKQMLNKKRPKASYEKSLEKQLNFIIESN